MKFPHLTLGDACRINSPAEVTRLLLCIIPASAITTLDPLVPVDPLDLLEHLVCPDSKVLVERVETLALRVPLVFVDLPAPQDPRVTMEMKECPESLVPLVPLVLPDPMALLECLVCLE